MKAKRKLSIRVKSKTERRIMEDPQVDVITEWNLKRIASAIIILLIFIVLPAYYLSIDDESSNKKPIKQTAILAETESPLQNTKATPANFTTEQKTKTSDNKQDTLADKEINKTPVIDKKVTTQQTSIETQTTPVNDENTRIDREESALEVATPEPFMPVETTRQATKEIPEKTVAIKTGEVQQTLLKPTETQYLNKHIIAAQLARGVENLTPFGDVYLPFLVNKLNAEGLFFYTQVKNMRGHTVFHEWLKQGKLIYKHKFNIRRNIGKIYTSKLFSYRAHGQWQVRIVNEQGEVLHKIDFSVQQQ